MARLATRGSLASLKREITIAGGGLAGLSLGTALRLRGVPVTILEAGHYPRHRVCGEFISGVSPETLDELGIGHLFNDARRPSSLAWYQAGRLVYRGELVVPAIGISRYVLDARIKREFESLGGVVVSKRATVQPREGLVWAAGRRPSPGKWLGLKAHVKGIVTQADLEMHAGRNGYAGLVEVEDGWTNLCGLFRSDPSIRAQPAQLLTAYLEKGDHRQLSATLRDCEWRAGSHSATAGFSLGRQATIPGLLAIGDAESMIPPFTGNGMAMAFQAAACAVEPLRDYSYGTRTWESAANVVRRALRKKFARRLAAAGILHPFLLEPGGRSLLQSLASARVLPFKPMLALVR